MNIHNRPQRFKSGGKCEAMLRAALPMAFGAMALMSEAKPTWPVTPSLTDSRQQLEHVFADPSDVPTGLYWYWISGNVSPDGVEADVRSMKKAGITRAYIGWQGLGQHEAPRGPVYYGTPEWYECLRRAMKTAAEEGIEIGLFNCPGWSQSGGPWVTPEQSQRYLAIAETDITGGKGTQKITLPHPENLLTDVKVLARKKLPQATITAGKDSIVADNVTDAEAMFDGDYTTTGGFAKDKATITIYPSKKDFTLRSVVMKTSTPVRGNITVSTLNNGKWTKAGTFGADRTNMMIEVGYDVLAPTAAALAETQAEAIKLDFQINENCRIEELVVSEAPKVNVYADQILSKMFQTPLPFWEQYKWPAAPGCASDAVTAPEEVIDLTANLNGDILSWDVPEGEWTVSRTYMAPTGICNSPALPGDGQGLEIDRWNPAVLEHHYDSYIGDIMRHIPAEERSTWKYIVSDSYERGTQNYGDDFMEYFQEHYGYDPTPYLLTFNGTVVGSQELSERFLWDLRRMIADRLAYDHLGAMRARANKDGFKLWLEPYGHWGFPGEFLMYGGQSDEVSGEFWSEGSLGDIENRAASSVAHTYGKGACWAESFTCGGNEFSRAPRSMKQRGDRFFTEGINSTLLHLMISQPDDNNVPGVNCPFGNEFNRKNTWFSQLDLFTDYLKRANHLLKQGNYVADVAYFIGEDAPAMTGTVNPALPKGYQYDFINAEVIENALEATADHKLTLPHGTTYRVLALAPLKTMRPELLRKIKQLLEDGAVIIGNKPLRSPSLKNYPSADAEVLALADEIWGEGENPTGIRRVGKGILMAGADMEQAFNLLGVTPDFTYTGNADRDIKYAHLSTPEREIYFVSNQEDKANDFTGVFRDGKGLAPELWDAVHGTNRPLPSYTEMGGNVMIPLRLEPFESAFIVFEKNSKGTPSEVADINLNYPPVSGEFAITTPWKVTLTPMVGKSMNTTFKTLHDLAKDENEAIRHFSGTIHYRTDINLKELPEGKQIKLDLGDMREMAKVKINGKEAGGLWTAPYTLDVTDLIKKGKNTIEIECVTTWVNRLVGDSALPEEERQTNYYYHSISPKTPLQSSGLLTPARLTFH